ncbi:unnamed protein product, partial [Candidula unifasciata]
QKPPLPFPPRTRKSMIFHEADYKRVDQYVSKMPSSLNYQTFAALVEYLTAPDTWDSIAKVRAIFRWVTSVDVFRMQLSRQPPRHSPMEYFQRIQNNMGNHAHLMAGLCQLAGIPCVIVGGINKSAAYEIGKSLNKERMSAQWNAVFVGGNWRFIDAFWASACVVGKKTGEWALVDADGDVEEQEENANEGETQHRINEFYFFPDPDQLIWTHFPDQPQWQLLEKIVTPKEFETHFYVRERFHILGMGIVPRTKIACIQETKDGETELCFGLPAERSSNHRFKYMVYRSRSAATQTKIDMFFDRFVLYEKQKDFLRFSLRFPVKGSFKIDIYGLDVKDGDVFDLCCTYIIECPQAKHNCLPYPDCPPIGWGPVSETEEAGLKPLSHKQAEIITKDGIVEIKLAKDRNLAFYQLLKHSLLEDTTLIKYSAAELTSSEALVHLRLPQKGEYALKLYAQDLKKQGPAQNILNYLINCSNVNPQTTPFPNLSTGLIGRNPLTDKSFGVQAISHPEAHINAKKGTVKIEFRADLDVELLCEMHTIDSEASRTMTHNVYNSGENWTFDLDMPIPGEYALNVFARSKEDSSQIYSVHSYLINSDGKKGSVTIEGDDDVDTSIPTETLETSEAEVTIPMPQHCKRPVALFYRRNGYDPPDPSQVNFFSTDDVNMVKVKLKNYGEYMLNLYDSEENGKKVKNIAKYQINRKRPGDIYTNINTAMDAIKTSTQSVKSSKEVSSLTSEDEAQMNARRNIQNAMDLKDIRHLEEAIKSFLAVGGSDNDPLVKKPRSLLEVLKAKQDLNEASQQRNLAKLEKAITRAKRANSNHDLDAQIALAVRLRDHLAKIDRLRHAVLTMEAKTIAEIRSYSNPPDGVHQCLIATCLLLGYQYKEVKIWQKVQVLLGKIGKDSVMRKISNFDAAAVPLKRAQLAKKIVQPYNKNQIRDVSAGAATFYVWAVGMIEEVETYGGTEQSDPLRLIQ